MERAPELAASVMQRSERDGKDWDNRLDIEPALDTFQALADGKEIPGLQAVVLNDSHLLVYGIGHPWWTNHKKWLIEQFFIRIGRGSADAAFHDLDEFAKSLGCSSIVMATSLAASDEALGRLYAKHGYSPQSSQHIKEL
jgi:hypothetical protein